jgi:hypothetical protein
VDQNRPAGQPGGDPRSALLLWAAPLLAVLAGAIAVARPFDAMALAVVVIAGFIAVRITRRVGAHDQAEMVRIFLLAFGLRIVAVFVLHYIFYLHNPGLLAPDEVGHDRDGLAIAAYLHHQGGIPAVFSYDTYVGLCYFIAPGFQLLPRIINATGGALTAVFTASAAGLLFGRREGRVAGVIVAVWPSAVLWSSLNLKDGWAMLAVAIIAYEIVRLREARIRDVAPGMIVGVLLLAFARAWILFVVAAGLTAGLLRTVPKGRKRAAAAAAVIAGSTILLVMLGAGSNYIGRLARVDITQVRASTVRGGSGFEGGISLQSPLQAIKSAPVALLTAVLAPFPWSISGLRQILSLPETLVMYALLPFAWRGFRRAAREKPEVAWPLLGAAGAVFVALGVVEGNLGLLYRHRMAAFVILFLFVGGGWVGARIGARERESLAAT